MFVNNSTAQANEQIKRLKEKKKSYKNLVSEDIVSSRRPYVLLNMDYKLGFIGNSLEFMCRLRKEFRKLVPSI